MAVRVQGFIDDHDAFLLANHGAVPVGRTLDEAWIRMESLEDAACLLAAARVLGRVNLLEPEAVGELRLRERRGSDV